MDGTFGVLFNTRFKFCLVGKMYRDFFILDLAEKILLLVELSIQKLEDSGLFRFMRNGEKVDGWTLATDKFRFLLSQLQSFDRKNLHFLIVLVEQERSSSHCLRVGEVMFNLWTFYLFAVSRSLMLSTLWRIKVS